jgi:hypothetical protein
MCNRFFGINKVKCENVDESWKMNKQLYICFRFFDKEKYLFTTNFIFEFIKFEKHFDNN